MDEHKIVDSDELEKDFKKLFSDSISESKLDEEFKKFLATLALRSEVEYGEDGSEEIELCLLQLKNIELKNKLNNISEQIKKAENQKDSEAVNSLIEEFNKLTKEL